jgi:hypothetical protein
MGPALGAGLAELQEAKLLEAGSEAAALLAHSLEAQQVQVLEVVEE